MGFPSALLWSMTVKWNSYQISDQAVYLYPRMKCHFKVDTSGKVPYGDGRSEMGYWNVFLRGLDWKMILLLSAPVRTGGAFLSPRRICCEGVGPACF